ncbi:MAG: hypothetical protein HF973_06135 [Chloroflexi bacterium]|nr:hypothetical protein [Chloroflexota bacterium]
MRDITFSDEHWPIVEMIFPSYPTTDEVVWFLQKLEELFARQETFAAVIVSGMSDNAARDKQATKKLMGWVKQNKPRFSQYCRGIVYVIEASAVQYAAAKLFSKMSGPRFYGCPVNTVRSKQDGLAWAQGQIGGQ